MKVMKAQVYKNYGDPKEVMAWKDCPLPVPQKGEVQIQVHASSVNYGNLAVIHGEPALARLWSGLFRPRHKIPGGDVAGVISQVGSHVSQWKVGDRVFGDLSSGKWGCYAQYVCTDPKFLVPIHDEVSFQDAAAAAQASVVALQGLRLAGGVHKGQSILVVGASGGIGSYAVQIAKAMGANVTALCSERNIELVKSLGTDVVINYQKHSLSDMEECYDVILATAGYHPIQLYKERLKPQGQYVATGGEMKQIFQTMFQGPLLSQRKGKKLKGLYQSISSDDLAFIGNLMAQGKVKSLIDRTYPMEKTQEALDYYKRGKSQGKVLLVNEF